MASSEFNSRNFWARGSLNGRGHSAQLLFGSVHEDATIERALLQLAPVDDNGQQRALCIASGGDTALSLLLENASVCALDINPAQIALCELKTAAIAIAADDELRAALHCDARAIYARAQTQLSPAARAFWQHPAQQKALACGLNFCGRVEGVFGRGAPYLARWLGGDAVSALFGAGDKLAAWKIFARQWNNWRWRLIFRALLNPYALRLIYAAGFVRAVPRGFGRIVRRRIESALLRDLPRDNPYANATLRGRYSGSAQGWPLWARAENLPQVRSRLSSLNFACGDVAQWLEQCAPASLHFCALSNVLDSSDSAYVQRLLRAIARATAPGALVCLRAVTNVPTSVWEATQEFFVLETQLCADLRARDVSLFCPLGAVLRRI